MALEQSILKSVKKVLGLPPEYTPFDEDVIMHINTVFADLNQMGVGPPAGVQVEDENATWNQITGGDPRYNGVKTYTYLRVKLIFDPPGTSFTQDAMRRQIDEQAWRLNVIREGSVSG